MYVSWDVLIYFVTSKKNCKFCLSVKKLTLKYSWHLCECLTKVTLYVCITDTSWRGAWYGALHSRGLYCMGTPELHPGRRNRRIPDWEIGRGLRLRWGHGSKGPTPTRSAGDDQGDEDADMRSFTLHNREASPTTIPFAHGAPMYRRANHRGVTVAYERGPMAPHYDKKCTVEF